MDTFTLFLRGTFVQIVQCHGRCFPIPLSLYDSFSNIPCEKGAYQSLKFVFGARRKATNEMVLGKSRKIYNYN